MVKQDQSYIKFLLHVHLLQINCGFLIVPLDISLPSKVLKGHPEGIKKLQAWLGDQRDWRLCYRATEHGWASGDFHSHCDNKKPTLTIVRVKQFIFGAYADVAFGGMYKLYILRLNNEQIL